MPRIELETEIRADQKLVFDLSRSIDLHKISTQHTNEKAVAGRMSGLIELNESVTWQARHLGITQELTSMITEFNYPGYFVDEMTKGIFKSIRHEHHFREIVTGTLLIDRFEYESPFGILGRLVDSWFLKNYMTNLLKTRNAVIKEFAETQKWKQVLA